MRDGIAGTCTDALAAPHMKKADCMSAFLRRRALCLLDVLADQASHFEHGNLGLAEHFLELRLRLFAAHRQVWRFAAIEPHQVGNKADLRLRPVAVSGLIRLKTLYWLISKPL